jgi:hypothetical protein
MLVNNELEKMWTEMVVAKFKVLYSHSPEGINKIREASNYDSRCPGRDLNCAPPEYIPEALLLEPIFLVREVRERARVSASSWGPSNSELFDQSDESNEIN